MRNVLALTALTTTLFAAGAVMAQQPSAKPTAPTTGAPATAQPSDATPSAAPTSSTPTTSSTAPPPATSSTAPSAGAAGANTSANAGASLMTGMSVKDNTGAIIGEVKDLKAGVATITMGSDTFTVDANKLGVSGGAATINATQAQLKQMIAGATKK
jgi:hypothetical protein